MWQHIAVEYRGCDTCDVDDCFYCQGKGDFEVGTHINHPVDVTYHYDKYHVMLPALRLRGSRYGRRGKNVR